jgi:hypothetical protein
LGYTIGMCSFCLTSQGIKRGVIIALFVFLTGCSPEEKSPPVEWEPPDTGSQDSGADTETGTDTGSDTGNSVPEAVEAVIEHDAPILGSCTRIDEESGGNPAVFYIDDQLFAFYTEGQDYSSPLFLRTSSLDTLDFSEPTSLLYGARNVDLIREDEKLKVLATRQFYTVLLESEDGIEWQEVQNIAPDEPTYNCSDFPPARFFRGGNQTDYLLMGNEYNTGIFGCTSRIFFARKTDKLWEVPHKIAQGNAIFGFQSEELLTVVSTFGVYSSEDEGETFAELKGGENTSNQLRGSGAAWTGEHLILVQSYNYANQYAIAAVFSEDGGATWDRRVILQSNSNLMGSPVIAADSDSLVVGWIAGGKIFGMTSPDGGKTWSDTETLDDLPPGTGASSMALAITGSQIAVMYKAEGVHLCLATGSQG